MSSHLVALMRQVSADIESARVEFHRPAEFRRQPKPEIMIEQVARVARILQEYRVTVNFRYDGKNCPDGTFTYDHAAIFKVSDKLFAFLPTSNWSRYQEVELDLLWIERFATVVKLPNRVAYKRCKFDPGTVVQAPNGVLIGFSNQRLARTNLVGATALKSRLEKLGYEGQIVLVEYSGLHLSTYCTCISTSEKPEPVFLAVASQCDVSAIGQLGEVILVDDSEAWRANTIANPGMRCLILMKRWLPGDDQLLQELEARGYKVEVVELTESPCVLGSLFCHVLLFQALIPPMAKAPSLKPALRPRYR